MSSFQLKIATLERLVFDQEVEMVTLPGTAGEFGVLANHMPMVTSLGLGEIVGKQKGEEFYMAISGGMAEVQPDSVIVLADQAERAEEIDEKLAESARERAEKIMSEKHGDAESFAVAEAELQRSLLRLRIARKHRTKNIHT
ncbi:MAG TPA: F0F1 ATP synthase subunit epsilon [Patescibacteria group bacterium]|nr:F0F1 ATP synthase subunit epsilon [Patescibacteria group bacterium]